MNRRVKKRGVIAAIVAACLLMAAMAVNAQQQTTVKDLQAKYQAAVDCQKQGEYAKAKQLLLEVKDTAAKQKVKLAPATMSDIDKRLTQIDAKMAAAPAAGLSDAQKADLRKIDAAKKHYKAAMGLMSNGRYKEALDTLLAVKKDAGDGLLTRKDAAGLDAKIAECRGKLAAPVEAKPVKTTVKPGPTVEQMKKFDELRKDPAIIAEMKRREAGRAVPRAPTTEEAFSKALADEQVRIQLAEQEIIAKIAQGTSYLRENRFDMAKKEYESARLKVMYGQYPSDFKKTWVDRIQKHLDKAEMKQEEHTKRQDELKKRDGVAKMLEELAAMKELRAERKKQLMEQTDTFIKRKQYKDALEVLEQIRRLDPEDPRIPKLIELTERKRLEKRHVDTMMARRMNTSETLIGVEDQLIPWSDITRYPDDWKEKSDRRLRAAETAAEGESPQDRKVTQKIQDTVVSFTFTDQPVMEALDFLQTLGGVNIVPDKSQFEDPDQTVTLKLNNVTLETALRLLTEQLDLKYVVRDGIVYISDEEGVRRPPTTSTYLVQDLLAPIPNFTGPTFELQNLSSTSGSSSTGSGSTSGIFGDDDDEEDDEEAQTPEEAMEDLINLIRDVIEPGSWDDASGNAIRGRQGQIVVTHTPEVQKKVNDLLNSLRKSRAIQVSIDIRFITVSDNFLEAIGFDWTGQDNPAASAPHYIDTDADGVPDVSTGLEYDRTISGGNWSAFGMINNALGIGATLGTGRGPGGAGGLTLHGSFLDDVEVNFILTAVQQSTRATVLNAPKLTMMNGQRAYIAISRQQNFVQDVSVEVSESAVGYDPEIGTVQDGIVFDVRPTVSADRRYVQMDMRPSIATIEDISEFETITGGVFGGAIIQLPEISVTVVRTTVSVPDGGTLLIGGLSQAYDNEMESGIPVLSKIPIFGKLFSRRGFTTEKSSIVILVKPTIIIQEELEPN